MAKFNVAVEHGKTRDEVVEKLRGFADLIKEKMPAQVSEVSEDWDDDGNLLFAFKASGFNISGKMVTNDNQVTVSGDLPFAALPFRGMLETTVAEKIREAIA